MSDTKTKLTRSKVVPTPGQQIPPGSQNITISWGGNGTNAIYGNGPFQIWFVYEGGPATSFNYSIDNGGSQPMSPGIYPNLSAQNNIVFDWQVNPSQPIKLVWIFLSGC